MKLIKNQNVEALITGITSEGSGVCKLDGFAIFVPDTAVNDFCEIKIIKLNKSYGYGKLVRVITPSPDRIEADCDDFVQCGGCTYRHISYQAELKIKQDMVADSFSRLGGITLPVNDIIGSHEVERYRNKAQYPVGVNNDDKLLCGFYAKRSHRVIDSKDCVLQPQIFSQIVKVILDFARENNISAYDEVTGSGLLRHIYIRQAEQTGEIMVCLVVTSFEIKNKNQLIEQLTSKFSEIKSIVLNKNSKNTNVILGNECRTIYGSDTITDILCGVRVEISPLSFYQVNRKQAERLYEKGIEYADFNGDEILLDLYCGAGTIGLAAANKVKKLIGVEIIPQAIENAKRNAENNGITNAEFICADASSAAVKLANDGVAPDVIIVDPPRKGLDEQVITAMVKMSPKKIVMVSCNPSTAARDCKLLTEQGYKITAITPVDLFPRTTHVECVVLMYKVEG